MSWDDAPGSIASLVDERRAADPAREVLVVGVTGPVGAGKSTLAAQLGGLVISTDNYLPDYGELPEDERDEPRHADLELLAEHLRALRARESVEIPVWSFHSHRRTGTRAVHPEPLLVCEGIHALAHPPVLHMDVRVYVDASPAHRWARWKRQEQDGTRGWGVAVAGAYFDNVAEPTFHRHAAAYMALADIIVENPLDPETESRKTEERT